MNKTLVLYAIPIVKNHQLTKVRFVIDGEERGYNPHKVRRNDFSKHIGLLADKMFKEWGWEYEDHKLCREVEI